MGYVVAGPGDRQQAYRDKSQVRPPFNESNAPYRYCVILDNGNDYLYADTLQDILEYLIPGYSEAETDEEETVLRIRYAGSAATMLQAAIIIQRERSKGTRLTDEEWGVLIAPKLGPNVARADWWTSDVPLVVVQTSYRPYTDSPRPAAAASEGRKGSTLLWLRPAEPADFLTSLHEAGWFQLMENTELEDADEED